MNDAWQQLYRLWESGTPGALATVVSAYGSAPRPPRSDQLDGRTLPAGALDHGVGRPRCVNRRYEGVL